MKKTLAAVCCLIAYSHISRAGLDAYTLHQATMARYSVAKKDYSTAKNRYHSLFYQKQSKHLQPRVPMYAYRGYLVYLQETNQFQEIVALCPRIESSYHNDPDILLLMAQALAHTGNVHDYSQKILALSTRFKEHPEIIFCAVQVYLAQKEPRNALAIIDTLLNTPPHRPSDRIFILLKSQIHAQLNEYDHALRTIQTCLDVYPSFDRAWLLYAMINEQRESLDNAIKGYRTFLELAQGSHTEIESHVLRLALQQTTKKKKSIFVHTANWHQIAVQRYARKDYQGALLAIDTYLRDKPCDRQGRVVKIQVLASLNAYTQAVALLTQWAQEEPTKRVWFDMMHMLCRTGIRYQDAYIATVSVAERHPECLLAHLYLAEYATRMGKHETAIGHCAHALTLTRDPLLAKALYCHMGAIHYQSGNLDGAVIILTQADSLPASYAPLDNLLAYCHATHTKNLAKAHFYCQKALASDPDNPHYHDTHAVILMEEKKYDQASSILQDAHHAQPTNRHILEHLAHVAYYQNNVEQARVYLEKAEALCTRDIDKQHLKNLYASWSPISHEKA